MKLFGEVTVRESGCADERIAGILIVGISRVAGIFLVAPTP